MFVTRSAFHWSVDLPAFQRIKIHFPRPKLADPPAAAQQVLDAAGGAALFGEGRRVASSVGRRGIAGFPAIIRTNAVLGLTAASHGNAVGIGLADVTTRAA